MSGETVGFKRDLFIKLREKHYKSQRKFAAEVAKHPQGKGGPSHISAIERGEREPSLTLLAVLCEVLGTNPGYLLGLTTDQNPHSDWEDQVIAGVEDPSKRQELQNLVDSLKEMSLEDICWVSGLVKRLKASSPTETQKGRRTKQPPSPSLEQDQRQVIQLIKSITQERGAVFTANLMRELGLEASSAEDRPSGG
jgi:transcriptional regulator with XRE-family HTH domain